MTILFKHWNHICIYVTEKFNRREIKEIKMSKRLLLVFIIALATLLLFANETIEFGQNPNTEATSISNSGFTANFAFENIKSVDVSTERGIFSNLSIEGYSYTTKIGEPKLPAIRKIIEVPYGASVSAELLNFTVIEKAIDGKIIPAQASISKSANSEDINFEMNNAIYAKSTFNTTRTSHIYFKPRLNKWKITWS